MSFVVCTTNIQSNYYRTNIFLADYEKHRGGLPCGRRREASEERHPTCLCVLAFANIVTYPNLGRVHDSIEKLLNSESKAVNSKQTELEFHSDNSEQLELHESNTQLKGLVEASAKSGNKITIKARGIRKFIRIGETTKSFEIDDLETKIQSPDLFQNLSGWLKNQYDNEKT